MCGQLLVLAACCIWGFLCTICMLFNSTVKCPKVQSGLQSTVYDAAWLWCASGFTVPMQGVIAQRSVAETLRSSARQARFICLCLLYVPLRCPKVGAFLCVACCSLSTLAKGFQVQCFMATSLYKLWFLCICVAGHVLVKCRGSMCPCLAWCCQINPHCVGMMCDFDTVAGAVESMPLCLYNLGFATARSQV